MLTLPIKKKWFDMILSGEKTEEYREIKPYWISRIIHWMGFRDSETKAVLELLRTTGAQRKRRVVLQNGYGRNAPTVEVLCTIYIGTGIEDWGAEPGEEYFIFTIHGKPLRMQRGREVYDEDS